MAIGTANIIVPTAGRELTARHQTLYHSITNPNYLFGVKCRMAATPFALVNTKSDFLIYFSPPMLASSVCHCHASSTLRNPTITRRIRRKVRSQAVGLTMFSGNPVVGDLVASVLSGGIAFSCLRFWEEIAKRGYFDQNLNRKLVHVSMGLVFMVCWPMFSSGRQGALVAALIPGLNIFKVLFLGLGILKDDGTVKSMSRFGDYRELLKGPLYYALTITLACAVYWRSSPIAIALVCNLCAGDGMADIIGRRIRSPKLPHNKNKSVAGSIAMATFGFLASIGFMHYFSSFGQLEKTPHMVLGFLVVSLVAALVESHPLSTELDDNLTVPIASVVAGSCVF